MLDVQNDFNRPSSIIYIKSTHLAPPARHLPFLPNGRETRTSTHASVTQPNTNSNSPSLHEKESVTTASLEHHFLYVPFLPLGVSTLTISGVA